MGVVTIVLAKRSLREHITRIETSEKGIGLLGFGVSAHRLGPPVLTVIGEQSGAPDTCEIMILTSRVCVYGCRSLTRRCALSIPVRLTISILELSSHADLAAFASALDRRRSDYQVLLKGLTFPRPIGDDVIPPYEEFLPEIRDRLISIEDCHVMVREAMYRSAKLMI